MHDVMVPTVPSPPLLDVIYWIRIIGKYQKPYIPGGRVNCQRLIHGLRASRNGAYIFVMPATPGLSMMISSVTSMGNGMTAHGVRMFLQGTDTQLGHPVDLTADGIVRVAI